MELTSRQEINYIQNETKNNLFPNHFLVVFWSNEFCDTFFILLDN